MLAVAAAAAKLDRPGLVVPDAGGAGVDEIDHRGDFDPNATPQPVAFEGLYVGSA